MLWSLALNLFSAPNRLFYGQHKNQFQSVILHKPNNCYQYIWELARPICSWVCCSKKSDIKTTTWWQKDNLISWQKIGSSVPFSMFSTHGSQKYFKLSSSIQSSLNSLQWVCCSKKSDIKTTTWWQKDNLISHNVAYGWMWQKIGSFELCRDVTSQVEFGLIPVAGLFAEKPTRSRLVNLQTNQLAETSDLKFAVNNRRRCDWR